MWDRVRGVRLGGVVSQPDTREHRLASPPSARVLIEEEKVPSGADSNPGRGVRGGSLGLSSLSGGNWVLPGCISIEEFCTEELRVLCYRTSSLLSTPLNLSLLQHCTEKTRSGFQPWKSLQSVENRKHLTLSKFSWQAGSGQSESWIAGNVMSRVTSTDSEYKSYFETNIPDKN